MSNSVDHPTYTTKDTIADFARHEAWTFCRSIFANWDAVPSPIREQMCDLRLSVSLASARYQAVIGANGRKSVEATQCLRGYITTMLEAKGFAARNGLLCTDSARLEESGGQLSEMKGDVEVIVVDDDDEEDAYVETKAKIIHPFFHNKRSLDKPTGDDGSSSEKKKKKKKTDTKPEVPSRLANIFEVGKVPAKSPLYTGQSALSEKAMGKRRAM